MKIILTFQCVKSKLPDEPLLKWLLRILDQGAKSPSLNTTKWRECLFTPEGMFGLTLHLQMAATFVEMVRAAVANLPGRSRKPCVTHTQSELLVLVCFTHMLVVSNQERKHVLCGSVERRQVSSLQSSSLAMRQPFAVTHILILMLLSYCILFLQIIDL